MSDTIKSIFERECDIVVNKPFVNGLTRYVQAFKNKNEEHIAFFGGNLMGVQKVRFRVEDRDRWFDEILMADETEIKTQVLELDAIVPSRIVSSDPMNLSCCWLVHAIYKAPGLTEAERHQGMIDAVMVLQYKFITSTLAYWFKYPADEDIAKTTYAALTKKFGLKVHGTWQALLLYRAEETVAKNSIHRKTIENFDDDMAVVRMVNDISSRIKDILKNVRDVFAKVQRNPRTVIHAVSGSTIGLDGEVAVKDLHRYYSRYQRYIYTVLGDPGSFLKPELVELVCSVVTTAPDRQVREVLMYMSKTTALARDREIDRVVELVLRHAFESIGQLRGVERKLNDIPGLMARLNGLYKASKSTDPLLMELKPLTESVVRRAYKTRNDALVGALRTAAMLYIALRTFTMHYYSR